ncbi:hypothetical protein [Spirosoma fluviale]|uniref:Uncharacterized protein n=1 Tax=Spirosoma fluviale TaxID=1597977 RepID=A0A286F643_9BACT|nr:hypothetical protein [Spirosoma fluviale]SOD78670.1 hypothetical protein SAMN06269250_0580 [Spirosoma fluviale]
MVDDPYVQFRYAVDYFCQLPNNSSALSLTRAFQEVRSEMHNLLDSVDDDAVIPLQPAGRLIEYVCQSELASYLLGDESALPRLRRKVRQAEQLLPG